MAAFVELPDFVSDARVEWTHKRAAHMQAAHSGGAGRRYSEAWRQRGVRLARARDAKVLKFLELSAERLWKLQAPQVSRFRQEGFEAHAQQSGEFTEFSSWKNALLLADTAPGDGCDPEVFGWIYGAVAEAVHGTL